MGSWLEIRDGNPEIARRNSASDEYTANYARELGQMDNRVLKQGGECPETERNEISKCEDKCENKRYADISTKKLLQD